MTSDDVRLILIGSSSHSGSTLLDLMLGSHSAVSSAGEMNRLSLFSEDRLCTCGSTVARCPYWSHVLARLATRLRRDDLHWSDCHTDVPPTAPLASLMPPEGLELVDSSQVPQALRQLLTAHGVAIPDDSILRFGGGRDAKWRVVAPTGGDVVVLRREKGVLKVYPGTLTWKKNLGRLPSALDLAVWLGADWSVPWVARLSREAAGLLETARNSWMVADAMAEGDGTRFVVDSSKTTVRLKLMHLVRPERTRVIYLVRDSRAVVASAMRRQRITAEVAARVWKRENANLARVLQSIPSAQKHQVRYEDVCADPAKELTGICAFLGISFEPQMVRLWERPVHNIPGNPMLFQKSKRDVTRDERWRRELSGSDLATVERIAGSLNRSFGYG
jgi:Sulfotransferase family